MRTPAASIPCTQEAVPADPQRIAHDRSGVALRHEVEAAGRHLEEQHPCTHARWGGHLMGARPVLDCRSGQRLRLCPVSPADAARCCRNGFQARVRMVCGKDLAASQGEE